jgi:hypothetical protein
LFRRKNPVVTRPLEEKLRGYFRKKTPVVTLERKTAWFFQWGAKLDKFFTADISPDYSMRYGVLLDQNRAKTVDFVMTSNRNNIIVMWWKKALRFFGR